MRGLFSFIVKVCLNLKEIIRKLTYMISPLCKFGQIQLESQRKERTGLKNIQEMK